MPIKHIYEYVPLKKLNLLQRFMILAFFPILIVVAVLGAIVTHFMADSMIRGETMHTEVHTKVFANKFLSAKDFDEISNVSHERFEEALRPILASSPEYKRIKVYDDKGTILWSDEEALIGQNFYDSNEELRESLKGDVTYEYGSLNYKQEHIFETEFKKGLEIYVPIIRNSKVIGVIETYRIPEKLFSEINNALLFVWIAAVLGGVFIYFALFWVVESSYKRQLDLEKSVFDSKERLENLIDGLKDGVALIDKNCNILTINKSLAEKFDVPLKSALGQKIKNYIFKGATGDIDSFCDEACMLRDELSFEFVRFDKTSNRKSFIKVNCFPLKSITDVEGGDYQSVLVISDITKEKELINDLLRTEKLATIGTLFPKISHEIRSPLNALELGLLTMQEKYPHDNVIKLLLSAKENLLRISNDLLAFSRVKKDQYSLTNINDVLIRVVQFLKETTGQIKYHELVEDYSDVSVINGIFGQLEQMFINIIINASQAMDELPLSKQKLTIGTYEDNGYVIAYVKDCGAGIKKEYADKIFDPFFTTKEEGKGTGLGMAIIKEIADKHNAEISFDSFEGKGTTFYVKFKIAV